MVQTQTFMINSQTTRLAFMSLRKESKGRSQSNRAKPKRCLVSLDLLMPQSQFVWTRRTRRRKKSKNVNKCQSSVWQTCLLSSTKRSLRCLKKSVSRKKREHLRGSSLIRLNNNLKSSRRKQDLSQSVGMRG